MPAPTRVFLVGAGMGSNPIVTFTRKMFLLFTPPEFNLPESPRK